MEGCTKLEQRRWCAKDENENRYRRLFQIAIQRQTPQAYRGIHMKVSPYIQDQPTFETSLGELMDSFNLTAKTLGPQLFRWQRSRLSDVACLYARDIDLQELSRRRLAKELSWYREHPKSEGTGPLNAATQSDSRDNDHQSFAFLVTFSKTRPDAEIKEEWALKFSARLEGELAQARSTGAYEHVAVIEPWYFDCLTLNIVERLHFRDIAGRLGRSDGAVRNAMTTASNALRLPRCKCGPLPESGPCTSHDPTSQSQNRTTVPCARKCVT